MRSQVVLGKLKEKRRKKERRIEADTNLGPSDPHWPWASGLKYYHAKLVLDNRIILNSTRLPPSPLPPPPVDLAAETGHSPMQCVFEHPLDSPQLTSSRFHRHSLLLLRRGQPTDPISANSASPASGKACRHRCYRRFLRRLYSISLIYEASPVIISQGEDTQLQRT